MIMQVVICGFSTDVPLYDMFKPTYVQCGLELEDNLGHLIFGTDTWQSMGSNVSSAQDPLTKYFQKEGDCFDIWPIM
jgi:hypothetical protein